MRLRVLWFGRDARSPFEEQVAEYRQRVSRRWPAEDIALRPAAGGRGSDPRRALQIEAETLRPKLRAGWPLVVLDEAGRHLDSEAFARLFGGMEAKGVDGVVIAIGSDLGLEPALRRQAAVLLSLSPLTLPHLLARLLLWEQLYRATDILGSGVYHRRRVE